MPNCLYCNFNDVCSKCIGEMIIDGGLCSDAGLSTMQILLIVGGVISLIAAIVVVIIKLKSSVIPKVSE